jgi:predicted DNA-binding protein (MmcQ/YjbR family)
MFCVTGLSGPFGASFKVRDEEFLDMCSHPAIIPAPYVARYKWVYVERGDAMSDAEWAERIDTSYRLVAAALPAKVRKGLDPL